jgi:transposase
MPAKHKFYNDWSPEKLLRWGSNIGEQVNIMIQAILDSRKYPEQAFRTCLGVLNLSKKYGDERLNSACTRALQFNAISLKTIHNILKNGVDKINESKEQQSFPEHENLRGGTYYKKGETK